MNTTTPKGKLMLISVAALVALLAITFAAAIAWGGPGPMAPLASRNEPFSKADFSAVQAVAHACEA
jgi:hypothetical protein